MSVCRHCGEEVEDARGFCPHCGKPLDAAEAAAGRTAAETPREEAAKAGANPQAVGPPLTVPMSGFGRGREEGDGSRRLIFIGVAIASALAVGLLAYYATRPSTRSAEATLEGAIRPGSPEFPPADRLVVEFDPDEHASIGPTALGPWAVTMKPTVRNFTNRTVTGLEFRAAGLDLERQPIRARTVVYDGEIEPNKVANPSFSLNFPQDNKPADLKLELTGVKFK